MQIPLFLLLLFVIFVTGADPVIIGHVDTPSLDQITLQRIYTGKTVTINGIRVTPVNLSPGNELRIGFLRNYLQEDEAEYIGYWTVRRYIGKGAPPQELKSSDDVLQFVIQNLGAIGYVDEMELTPEVKVLLKK
ncbi:hypothetical protein [Chromatium okenii]|uniref:Phosphate ABC transporter substrate-binding protein n=1 Tax=Chromatium okenii TaxID=61644 RepID=A0A2S7XT72_9GAMM|nr:hypothetical protein [Chromatium okenii]PQJ96612.1 hypothetical protein CXB77_07380 [Chromatium okenii]